MITVPLAVSIGSASQHESQLVARVLRHSFLDTLPTRLIGDKDYDSDRLAAICPNATGSKWSHHIAETDEGQLKTGVHGIAIADVGEWKDYSLGSITFVGWSSAGSTVSRTSFGMVRLGCHANLAQVFV